MAIKYALFSVTDKTGIIKLARKVSETHKIIASGGTTRVLRDNGIEVTQISEVTNYPELFEGRVKTLHPKIYGGILFKEIPEHRKDLEEHDIPDIDLVVCNLYNFSDAINENPREDLAIENIDIGGVTLIRAAAKNFNRVSVLVDPKDYDKFINKFPNISKEDRTALASKAFSLVTHYDIEISKYMNKIARLSESFFDASLDEDYFLGGKLAMKLRYGENPHQSASVYNTSEGLFFKHVAGPKSSYNNILDMTAGWGLVNEFDDPACVIIKHRSPAGVATAKTLKEAYLAALSTDKKSAYGGVYVFNKEIDKETAEEVVDMFVDVIYATNYNSEALEILQQKEKLTILVRRPGPELFHELVNIPGGFIVQSHDVKQLSGNLMRPVSDKKPDNDLIKELQFAWKVVKHARSNAIAIIKGNKALGIGSGDTSRVDAMKTAIKRAGNNTKGAILASDAFFPFPDSIELAAEAGIKAILVPSGSIRDQKIIESANKHGIILVFSGIRAFKH